jgi:hypothetical protein
MRAWHWLIGMAAAFGGLSTTSCLSHWPAALTILFQVAAVICGFGGGYLASEYDRG